MAALFPLETKVKCTGMSQYVFHPNQLVKANDDILLAYASDH